MSRVSEALERASTEVPQLFGKSSHPQGSRVGEDTSEGATDADATAESNSEARAAHSVGSLSEPSWSLAKRLQRLIFGKGVEKYNDFALVFQEKQSLATEQYKKLREQVKRLYENEDTRLLAVMSPVKGDGKSTVAANLSAVIALEYGQQVLLIDADLRSPSIHNFFGLNSTPGLADYLASSVPVNISNFIQDTCLPGLRILPAGRPTHLSAELLATEKMKTLLKDIPRNFPGYQVVIDTSPVLSTSDPLVLAHLVRDILMVIRAGSTSRDCLTEAITSLGPDRVKGIILNGASVMPSSKYYYYYE
jgi:protein-tyrosine kinase